MTNNTDRLSPQMCLMCLISHSTSVPHSCGCVQLLLLGSVYIQTCVCSKCYNTFSLLLLSLQFKKWTLALLSWSCNTEWNQTCLMLFSCCWILNHFITEWLFLSDDITVHTSCYTSESREYFPLRWCHFNESALRPIWPQSQSEPYTIHTAAYWFILCGALKAAFLSSYWESMKPLKRTKWLCL